MDDKLYYAIRELSQKSDISYYEAILTLEYEQNISVEMAIELINQSEFLFRKTGGDITSFKTKIVIQLLEKNHSQDEISRLTGVSVHAVSDINNENEIHRQEPEITSFKEIKQQLLANEIEKLINANFSQVQIAKALGISQETVHKYRKKYNLPELKSKRKSGNNCTIKNKSYHKQIVDMLNKGMTLNQIALSLNKSRQNIHQYCQRHMLIEKGSQNEK